MPLNFVNLSSGSKPLPTAPMAQANEPWCIIDMRTLALHFVASSALSKVALLSPVTNCTILSRASAGFLVLSFLPPSETSMPRAMSSEKEV